MISLVTGHAFLHDSVAPSLVCLFHGIKMASLLFLCVPLMHHLRYSGPSGQRTPRLLTQAGLNEGHFFYPSVSILISQERTNSHFNRKSLSELWMIKLFNQVLPHNLNKETVILAMIVLVLPTPGVL